jgi:hypothetical protein
MPVARNNPPIVGKFGTNAIVGHCNLWKHLSFSRLHRSPSVYEGNRKIVDDNDRSGARQTFQTDALEALQQRSM